MDHIKRVLEEGRGSISEYCIHTCKALCCRKGALLLRNKEEVEIVTKGESVANRLQTTESGMVTLELGEKGNCPKLQTDNLCKIYALRPQVCRDFPLAHSGTVVMASPMCEAVKNGLLELYLQKLRDMGCRIL